MSAREGFEKVSKEKFVKFVKRYDGELHTHWVGFCSPPCTEYYDERREVDDKWLSWYDKHFFMVVAYFFDEFMGIEPEYYIRVSDEDRPAFDKLPLSEQIEKLKSRCESAEAQIDNLDGSIVQQMSEEQLYSFIKKFPDRVYCEKGRVYIGGLLGYRYISHKAGDPIYYTEEDYERIKNGGYE